MAKDNVNTCKIEGTLYDKPVVTGYRKKDGEPFEKKYIVLELDDIPENKGQKFMAFRIGYGAIDSGFEKLDRVIVGYQPGSHEYQGNWYSELNAKYIKHADLQTGNDTRNLSSEPFDYKKKKVEEAILPMDDDDLPF